MDKKIAPKETMKKIVHLKENVKGTQSVVNFVLPQLMVKKVVPA